MRGAIRHGIAAAPTATDPGAFARNSGCGFLAVEPNISFNRSRCRRTPGRTLVRRSFASADDGSGSLTTLPPKRVGKTTICRIAAGVLVVLVGVAVGFAGIGLLTGAYSSSPDLIASAATTKSAALGMLMLAAMLLLTGAAATINLRWGQWTSAVAILAFVIGGFWVNHVLFGDIRPVHTGTNVDLGALILSLLWAGSRRAA